jgi:hypothetical protein
MVKGIPGIGPRTRPDPRAGASSPGRYKGCPVRRTLTSRFSFLSSHHTFLFALLSCAAMPIADAGTAMRGQSPCHAFGYGLFSSFFRLELCRCGLQPEHWRRCGCWLAGAAWLMLLVHLIC